MTSIGSRYAEWIDWFVGKDRVGHWCRPRVFAKPQFAEFVDPHRKQSSSSSSSITIHIIIIIVGYQSRQDACDGLHLASRQIRRQRHCADCHWQQVVRGGVCCLQEARATHRRRAGTLIPFSCRVSFVSHSLVHRCWLITFKIWIALKSLLIVSTKLPCTRCWAKLKYFMFFFLSFWLE